MPLYLLHIDNVGSTTIRIRADDRDAAEAIYEDGEWRSRDPHWEQFHLDEIEEIEDDGKPDDTI
jgi:hypothetical protein